MGVYNASGTRVTRANVPVSAYTDPDPVLVVGQKLTRKRVFPGQEATDLTEGSEQQILAEPGQLVRTSQVNNWFPTATVTSLSPTSGTASGGTTVTIKGTNLDGVTSVTFGGTAGTALTLVDSQTVTVVTPAKTAATVTVVVVDDSGSVTDTNAFTFS